MINALTAETGRHSIDLDELLGLQRIVIGDARLGILDFATSEKDGEHDRDNRMPILDRYCATDALRRGTATPHPDHRLHLELSLAAARWRPGFAFGIHRRGRRRRLYHFIHHVLAERFNPAERFNLRRHSVCTTLIIGAPALFPS